MPSGSAAPAPGAMVSLRALTIGVGTRPDLTTPRHRRTMNGVVGEGLFDIRYILLATHIVLLANVLAFALTVFWGGRYRVVCTGIGISTRAHTHGRFTRRGATRLADRLIERTGEPFRVWDRRAHRYVG